MRPLILFRSIALLAVAWLATSCLGLSDPGDQTPVVQFLIVSGNNQVAPAGEELPQPVRVQATDASNQPVPNVVVNFIVTSGGGSVFAQSALTDASGYAATVWRLGPTPGTPQTLEVRSVDAQGQKHVYGTFSATAAALPPASVTVFEGDGQSAIIGTAVAIAPAVVLKDAAGNPVAGQSVTFAVASGGGSVTGATAVSDAAGVARVNSWILGPAIGPNSLTATAAALPGTPVTFTATGTPAGSLSLATPPPASAENAVPFSSAPVLQLVDGTGTPVGLAGISVTATVVSGATATGTTMETTDASGQATFDDLSITGPVGSYQLTFTAPGVGPVTSSPIAIGAGLPANVAVNGGDAQTVNAGSTVPVAPSVVVTDVSDNPVPGASVTFTVVLGGGSVTGGNATTGANGVAQVGSWILGPLSGPNGLQATVAGLPAVDVTFAASALGDFWVGVQAMPSPRRWVASAVVNGILYVAGGRDAGGSAKNNLYAYDPATNTWSTRHTMSTARVGAMGWAQNGLFYVAGGTASSGSKLRTVEAYDPATDSWTAKASMPEERIYGAVGVINGLAYMAGGNGNSGPLASAYAYDPVANSWTPRASLPVERPNVGGAALNGLFYVVGGAPIGGADGALLSYDPATDTWTNRPPMPTLRYHVQVEVVNGLLYALSGRLKLSCCGADAVEVFDPATDSWVSKAPMLTARFGAATGLIDGLIYTAGGDSGTATLSSAERYVP